ncbi:hypothetical protein QYM36_017932 [Artemia franciscana]|uniref:Uncharacterized protein n=1 Tax=Artemia franciscana TaxID=6661 RepID=A0AA88KUE8_ARTSF|nr:hypothetical protein QYM36_017932 [Artemia franciscana]
MSNGEQVTYEVPKVLIPQFQVTETCLGEALSPETIMDTYSGEHNTEPMPCTSWEAQSGLDLNGNSNESEIWSGKKKKKHREEDQKAVQLLLSLGYVKKLESATGAGLETLEDTPPYIDEIQDIVGQSLAVHPSFVADSCGLDPSEYSSRNFSERVANRGGASIEGQGGSSSLLETEIERNESAADENGANPNAKGRGGHQRINLDQPKPYVTTYILDWLNQSPTYRDYIDRMDDLIYEYYVFKIERVKKKNKKSDEAMLYAIMKHNQNNLILLKYLLKNGANPNAIINEYKYIARKQSLFWKGTVLHVASRNGNVNICQLLVSNGAAIDALDSWQRTPLSVAVSGNHISVTRYLLEKGANPNAKGGWGYPRINRSIWDQQSKPLVAEQVFLNFDIWLNHRREFCFWSVWSGLAYFRSGRSDLIGQMGEIMDNFKKCECDPCKDGMECQQSCSGYRKETVLHVAARNGNFDIWQLLISKGADINCLTQAFYNSKSTKEMNKKLSCAIMENQLGLTEYLLENGADPNTVTGEYSNVRYKENLFWKETILHAASRSGNLNIFQLLVSFGAAIDALDSWQKKNPLSRAVIGNHISVTTYLLENGANPNAKGGGGHQRINLDQPKPYVTTYILDWLNQSPTYRDYIDRMDDLIYEYYVFKKERVVHIAARNGNFDIWQQLISKGGDINCLTSSNKT